MILSQNRLPKQSRVSTRFALPNDMHTGLSRDIIIHSSHHHHHLRPQLAHTRPSPSRSLPLAKPLSVLPNRLGIPLSIPKRDLGSRKVTRDSLFCMTHCTSHGRRPRLHRVGGVTCALTSPSRRAASVTRVHAAIDPPPFVFGFELVPESCSIPMIFGL
jgi:hypothetical protein